MSFTDPSIAALGSRLVHRAQALEAKAQKLQSIAPTRAAILEEIAAEFRALADELRVT